MVKNFTFSELTRTNTKLANTPNDMNIVDNLCFTATMLQHIRDRFGFAIRVTSCYRSPAVNAAVKGSSTSAHLQGLAADICAYSGKSADNRCLLDVVLKCLDYSSLDIDQVIVHTVDGSEKSAVKFIHVGWTQGVPRHQILYSK